MIAKLEMPLGVIELELWQTHQDFKKEGGEGAQKPLKASVRVREIAVAIAHSNPAWTLISLGPNRYWVKMPYDEISALMRNA